MFFSDRKPQSDDTYITRLQALADAYEPGMYALADGVCHVYGDEPRCCQQLRDDILLALSNSKFKGE